MHEGQRGWTALAFSSPPPRLTQTRHSSVSLAAGRANERCAGLLAVQKALHDRRSTSCQGTAFGRARALGRSLGWFTIPLGASATSRGLPRPSLLDRCVSRGHDPFRPAPELQYNGPAHVPGIRAALLRAPWVAAYVRVPGGR